MLHRWSGRGKTSGVELGQIAAKGAGLFHIRGGKVIQAVTCFNRENALAEVGLAKDPAPRYRSSLPQSATSDTSNVSIAFAVGM